MAPSIHASASELIDYFQRTLHRAAADGRHPWRLPVLITGCAGRVLVLRGVDGSKGSWRFYTDARTPKVDQIDTSEGSLAATFYHPKERSQLRLKGKAVLLEAEPRRNVWEKLAIGQRSSYAALSSPGSTLEVAGDGLSKNWNAGNPTKEEQELAYSNFTVYDFLIDEVELLLLHREGHRRCCWRGWNGEGFKWLVP